MAAVPNISTAQLQGVADPNMRIILRAIVDSNAVRNGEVGSGDDAFVTMGDLLGGGAKARSIASALARPIAYQVATEGGDPWSLGAALEQRIISSAAWRLMFTRIELLTAPDSQPGSISNQLLLEAKSRGAAIKDVSRTVQQANDSIAETTRTLTAALGANAAAIERVDRAQATATDALAQSQQQFVAATKNSIAGLQQDITVKTNNDNALAQALNTLWTRIGANTALVQTGQEIVANNVGSVVTKFEQLQSVVTDPVTGLVASYSALRTEYSATNDKVNGMAAKWSVKLDLNGYVSGLSLNAGVTPEGKSESMMLFAADVFAVGAPGKPNMVPFAIDTQTGLVAIRGDLLVKNSITANSGILASASIGKAHIQDAAVDTLKIGPNSVIVPAYAEGVNDGTNYYAGTMIEKGQLILTLADYGSIVAIVTFQSLSGTQGQGFNPTVKLAVDGQQFMYQSNSGSSSYHQAWTANGRVTLPPGRHVFTISFGNDWYEGWYQLGRWAITLLGVMR